MSVAFSKLSHAEQGQDFDDWLICYMGNAAITKKVEFCPRLFEMLDRI